MNRKLKQSVRQHIESYSLTDDQLQELASLGKQAKTAKRYRVSGYSWALTAAVATFLLMFMLTPLFFERNNMHEHIAREVAANHIKLKPLEIETASIDAVRDYFNKLEFVPANSTLVDDLGLELTGGRYCSLQGVAAAQLRLQRPGSDEVQTLYQTEYRKDVFDNIPVLEQGEVPTEIYAKGIRVRIWAEKGLLFALTEEPK